MGLGARITSVVGARVRDLGVENVEGVGGPLPGSAGSVTAGGGVFFGPTGFEAGLDFGQGEVGRDFASGVVDLLMRPH